MSDRIAIQGIRGCFHEMAARKYFHSEIPVKECITFRELCESIDKGESKQGIMAIENSLAGSILSNYSLIEKYDLSITGEVYLHIEMNLMALPGSTISDVKEVISHPVALAQCQEYLYSLDQVELKEHHDTAAAAKWINENNAKGVAAVANKLASELYNLEILSENIETHKENFTRFLIVSKDSSNTDVINKASISLQLSHEPGSLSDILLIFKNNQVNLTKIQSLPIIGRPYQYAFHIDITFHDTQGYRNAISEIEDLVYSIKVLGEYKSSSFNLND